MPLRLEGNSFMKTEKKFGGFSSGFGVKNKNLFKISPNLLLKGGGENDDAMEMFKLWLHVWS